MKKKEQEHYDRKKWYRSVYDAIASRLWYGISESVKRIYVYISYSQDLWAFYSNIDKIIFPSIKIIVADTRCVVQYRRDKEIDAMAVFAGF